MTLDEELLQDAQEDAEAVKYIHNHLPQEIKDHFNEDQLYYFLDLIIDYYSESGILDSTPDKDGFIEIDGLAIANHLAIKAKKEGMGIFDPEELLFVVEAHFDFEEEQTE